MNNTFMKEKPVLPLLASMALPMVLSMLVNSLYNIVDSFFVAKISEEAMTALSLVYPVQNFINAIAIGFGVGINAQISFQLGAKNLRNANTAATHGMLFNIIHGIVITALCIPFMPVFLKMFTKEQEVITLGTQYSTIAFAFSVVIMVSLSFEKIFQAVGRMKITMISLLVGCISNIILDPLLIFGVGFFPKMGIKGAALATGLGQVFTVIVYLIAYAKCSLPVEVSRKYLKLNRNLDAKLYMVGVPAILNIALPSVLISFLNQILSAFSGSYVVVLGIYYKLQTFLYLPASGIVQGMRPLMGYNYGAGETKRVKKISSKMNMKKRL
jgi:putative MATE family efflux protein